MKNKGITLVSLIFTVIILGIIASVIIYSGINTITASRLKRFQAEMEIIRLKCNELLEEGVTIEDLLARGQDIATLSSSKLEKINNALQKVTNSTNTEGYVYFNSLSLQDLGIVSINKEVIINFNDKVIIDINGVKDDNNEYIYTIEWTSNAVLATNEKVQSITLDNTSYTLTIGKIFTLTPIITPSNANNKKVTWTSSDETIATVTQNGVVTGKSKGTATITATTVDGGKVATCVVTVKVPVGDIRLSSYNIIITLGSTHELTATIEPDNATNKEVTWSSSDSSVATVNNGIVTALKSGTAIITVKTVDDENKTASCIVKVSPFDTTKVPDVVIETSTIAGVNKQRIAPIPEGYTVSKVSTEDEISEGLVIYQTETAVTGEPNSDAHKTAMEGINQYVWIPIDDINDMVMCKKNGSTGTNGTTTVCNLVYNSSTEEITCNTHGYTTSTTLTTSNIDTVGLAGRLYGTSSDTTDTAAPYIYTTSMEFTTTTRTSQTFTKDSGYREPDIVTDYDKNDATSGNTYMADAGIADATAASLKAQLNFDFIAMAKSVAKYGGFYISRYELSYENSKVISKKNKAVLTAATSTSGNYIEGTMWYGLYNKTKNETDKESSVSSHIVWGCQYDQVIKFIGDEAQVGHLYQTPSQEKTGYEGDQDILNNIYDLEGNNWELTAQAYSTNLRGCRGRYYSSAYNSLFYPASYRSNGYPNSTDSAYATRSTLYVAL